MDTTKQYLPKFPLPEGYDSADEYLRTLTLQGMQRRYSEDKENSAIVKERIEYELSVIHALDSADYFLIVWDALLHARKKGILIGPGRGSAAGSVVNYCLGITQVDPLKYGLLFERFLTTNRSIAPDIDTDGDEQLFDEMLCYLPRRYGRNHVARIANHVCGIVISSEDVTKHFPTTSFINRDGEAMPVIMAKGGEVEDAGFLKFDFLWMEILTTIRCTIENIKTAHEIEQISLDDAATLKLYREGKTARTFEFNSKGKQCILRQMSSITFLDLVALYALYRPGPWAWIPDFIARKSGKQAMDYPNTAAQKYLSETYGLTIYGEQIMQLSQTLADFTPNESDRLRKSLQKKTSDCPYLKEKFVSGATAKGYSRNLMEQLWQEWEAGGSYAFTKSHAICYTLIAFQTAYLKAHFPAEYMAAYHALKAHSPAEYMTADCAQLQR